MNETDTPAGGTTHTLDSLHSELPDDVDFRTWWFTVPHHRRERIEQWVDSARILHHHATTLTLERGHHELWAGLRKNHGTTLTDIANHLGVDAGGYSRWEHGHTYPAQRTRDKLQPALRNIANDLYHRSLVRLTWELHWTDKKKNAPEQIDVANDEYLTWLEHNGPTHPLLEELPHSLPHDPAIPWPIAN